MCPINFVFVSCIKSEETGVFWIQKCSIMQKPYGATLNSFYYYFMTFKHRNHSWSLVVTRSHS
jgi:hypothetical protein